MKFRWETEFKETEIGEIPKDWEVSKAIEHIEFIRGIEPGSKFYKNFGKYKFIRVGNLSGERNEEVFIDIEVENEKIANKDDILISFDGTVGIVKMGLEGVFSSGIRKIKVKEQSQKKLNYKFLYWFFKSTLKNQIFGFSDEKTTIAHAGDSIPHLKIFLSPLSEQSRIAQVLSYFDDLIENKKKQNEILEKTAMAIFKNWFIDFEPFKDQEFVYNEELGKEIPKGWEVKRLGEVAEIIKGVSYNTPDISSNSEGEVFITLNNFLRGGGFKSEYSYYIGTRAKENHIVKNGDLIIALTDMTPLAQVVGAPAIVILPYGYEKGIISLDCAKIKLNNDYLKFYIYLYLKYTQEENSTFAGGVNVLHLKLDLFKANKFILIPPPSILQHFHSLVEPLFQKIIINQKQIMTLKKVRDTLLPLLVFGKLRIEEL
ncbi:restriction endonuclease subunit S [Hydrogenobacter hydrogenophilus]|uniref:Type I restriction enzyme, S subunit n=1 Tax=Hydrogenobacter hydrogenophilus TaxID=35835 RepID=A0A285NRG2_9AQUI|nr:restriction endonuclease subunit S [Hydrogenobacter hydrogenophilus]SNZ12039.1 type I restriction enzyme, S subunit [Hydrogenobacter hydrogenophilus]